MTEIDQFAQFASVAQDFGIWAVFLYLFINERTAHNVTRDRHMEDLRDVAGMKIPLHNANEL